MKNVTTLNLAAAVAGRFLLFCYRTYFYVQQQVGLHKAPAMVVPGPHVRFTQKQFTRPCYN